MSPISRQPKISRRSFLGVAAGAVGAAALGACGSNADNATSNHGVEFWHVHDGAAQKAVQTITSTFTSGQATERLYGGYSQVLQQLRIASAAGHDRTVIAEIGNTYLVQAATTLNNLPVDVLLSDLDDNGDWLSALPANIRALGVVQGVQQGVPLSLSVPVLYYNADMFKAAGISAPPATWQEMSSLARTLGAHAGVPGFAVTETKGSTFMFSALVQSHGGQVLSDVGGQVRCLVAEDPAIAAIDAAATIARSAGGTTVDTASALQSFTAGKIGMFIASSAYLTRLQDGVSFTLGTAPFPTFNGMPRSVADGGNVLFVFFATTEAKKRLARDFLKHTISPESMTTWVKGTGYVPLRNDLAQDSAYLKPYYDSTPLAKPALDELGAVQPMPRVAEAEKINQVIYDGFQRALTGAATTASAMRTVVTEVNKILEASK